MIIKSNARAGATDLANHLCNGHENERVIYSNSRGVLADDIHGSLDDLELLAMGTRTQKSLYSVSVNPDQDMTDEQWEQLWRFYEAEFNMSEQSFIEVTHVKKGRLHKHRVYSRVDFETGLSISVSYNWPRNEKIARVHEYKFGHDLTIGKHNGSVMSRLRQDGGYQPVIDWMNRGGAREVSRPIAAKDFAEHQLEQRLQKAEADYSIERVLTDLQDVWVRTDNGQTFQQGLAEKGYLLARGNRRDFVVIDPHGQVHNPARRLKIKVKDLRERWADLDPSHLPVVEQVQKEIKQRRLEQERADLDQEIAVLAQWSALTEWVGRDPVRGIPSGGHDKDIEEGDARKTQRPTQEQLDVTAEAIVHSQQVIEEERNRKNQAVVKAYQDADSGAGETLKTPTGDENPPQDTSPIVPPQDARALIRLQLLNQRADREHSQPLDGAQSVDSSSDRSLHTLDLWRLASLRARRGWSRAVLYQFLRQRHPQAHAAALQNVIDRSLKRCAQVLKRFPMRHVSSGNQNARHFRSVHPALKQHVLRMRYPEKDHGFPWLLKGKNRRSAPYHWPTPKHGHTLTTSASRFDGVSPVSDDDRGRDAFKEMLQHYLEQSAQDQPEDSSTTLDKIKDFSKVYIRNFGEVIQDPRNYGPAGFARASQKIYKTYRKIPPEERRKIFEKAQENTRRALESFQKKSGSRSENQAKEIGSPRQRHDEILGLKESETTARDYDPKQGNWIGSKQHNQALWQIKTQFPEQEHDFHDQAGKGEVSKAYFRKVDALDSILKNLKEKGDTVEAAQLRREAYTSWQNPPDDQGPSHMKDYLADWGRHISGEGTAIADRSRELDTALMKDQATTMRMRIAGYGVEEIEDAVTSKGMLLANASDGERQAYFDAHIRPHVETLPEHLHPVNDYVVQQKQALDLNTRRLDVIDDRILKDVDPHLVKGAENFELKATEAELQEGILRFTPKAEITAEQEFQVQIGRMIRLNGRDDFYRACLNEKNLKPHEIATVEMRGKGGYNQNSIDNAIEKHDPLVSSLPEQLRTEEIDSSVRSFLESEEGEKYHWSNLEWRANHEISPDIKRLDHVHIQAQEINPEHTPDAMLELSFD